MFAKNVKRKSVKNELDPKPEKVRPLKKCEHLVIKSVMTKSESLKLPEIEVKIEVLEK